MGQVREASLLASEVPPTWEHSRDRGIDPPLGGIRAYREWDALGHHRLSMARPSLFEGFFLLGRRVARRFGKELARVEAWMREQNVE